MRYLESKERLHFVEAMNHEIVRGKSHSKRCNLKQLTFSKELKLDFKIFVRLPTGTRCGTRTCDGRLFDSDTPREPGKLCEPLSANQRSLRDAR